MSPELPGTPRYDWQSGKRDALNAWATRLQLIVTSADQSNVVAITAAKAAS